VKRVVDRKERSVTPSGRGTGTEFVLLSDLGAAISRIVLPPIRAVSMVVNGALTAASATITTLGSTALTATSATIATLIVSGAVVTSRGASVADGNSQATATPLSASVDNFAVSGANGTAGVLLPVATAGRRIFIKNTAAAALNVYPNAGAAINGIAANGAYAMAASTSAFFIGDSATQWYTCPLVAS
jgi:hypothetical protein